MKAALWKYNKELGIEFLCPDCKRFVCVSGKCECGSEIDLSLPKIEYEGKGNMERLTFHIRVGLDYYTGVFKDRKGGII